jgi:predicted HicB family RNase H-like nuclease
MMEHLGYIGAVVFDDEAGIFHGQIVNTKDVITFQGESVAELKNAFVDSIEDYLEFCAARGEAAEKPMSGKFNVRISPKLHALASASAHSKNISLNRLVQEAIEQYVS